MSDNRTELEQRVSKLAPLVGAGLLVAGGLYAVVAPGGTGDVLQAFTVAFAYWWTLAVGGLALAALHQLVSGRWGLLASRSFEATARTIPFVGVAFLPIALGLGLVYPWVGAGEESLGQKAQWLEPSFFTGRVIAYFAVWTLLAYVITSGSVARDKERRKGQRERLIKIGAGSLLLFVLTVSFAALDWFMSLEPDWYSTIYGALFVVDAGLTALALGIIVVWLRSGDEENAEYATTAMWGDLGNLLLALIMVWAYFNFSQFLIIWSADLPVEGEWYFVRSEGGWLLWANAVAILHFVVPFVVLLNNNLRRSPKGLACVAAYMLVAHFVGVFWTVAPAFGDGKWAVWILSWVLWIGLGGVWLGLFSWQLGRYPLLPVNDPAAERHRRRAAGVHTDHSIPAVSPPEATT